MSGIDSVDRPSILIVSEFAPYQTNLFALVAETTCALVSAGASVTLWMCGFSTMACSSTTGTETSPLLSLDKSRPPTMKGLLVALRKQFLGCLRVVCCAECSGERGYSVDREHFTVGYLAHYSRYVEEADKIYYLGRA
ncbi:hypothetical protein ACIBCN_41415 [Nocardia sp. NPDC051052]|uniref:hypothetical protein n=1 Tax=Nocardia sp. NPDC051052 TaxID=3364322 RepID=UPI00378DCD47